MAAMIVNRLTLALGRSEQFGLVYSELVVDGRPLRELLSLEPRDEILDHANRGPAGENVAVLVHNWPMAGAGGARVLLGEETSELADGRVPLYVCPVCGDLGCGAVSALVERSASHVIWRDFGWEVGWDDGEEEIRFVGGPFVFDRRQYDAELREFVDTYDHQRARAPVREASPRPPRRRWPWHR
ncbi:MAG: hypothetical protein HGA44_10100 [Cellulomonadaceae bacterium]|nr:hypothetical protein [Cellulomonadaceae bacterium]